MKFARNIIKLAAVTMLLLALVFVLSAAAEEDPVEFAIEVNPTSLAAFQAGSLMHSIKTSGE